MSLMSNQTAARETQTPQPVCHVNPYEHLKLILNPEGTLTRPQYPTSPPTITSDPNSHSSAVLSKDVPINPQHKKWLRIYLPETATSQPVPTTLPIILYFHGGGFIFFNVNTTLNHDFCVQLAAHTPALVVSVEYRLAPEHRLPAAYDDALEALQWIKDTNEEWLSRYGDYSSCFLMGNSAGGNIVYHLALKAAGLVDRLKPLKINGLILHNPFFGGSERTGSEVKLTNDWLLPISVTDLMWELALPVGADRDHEYSNVVLADGGKELEQVNKVNWPFFVSGCDGDPLFDRQVEFVKFLERKGVNVEGRFTEGEYHTVEIFEPSKAGPLLTAVKKFMASRLPVHFIIHNSL